MSSSPAAFARTLDWATRWVVLICIPATSALMILAWPLIATIYFHGDFTENGVNMSALSLIAYAIGLVPIVMVKVLAPGYYARKNTRTPVRIGVIAVLINIAISLLLFVPMQHIGLALATSVAAIANALLLYLGLRREGVFIAEPGWKIFLARVAGATILMSALLLWAVGEPSSWLIYSTMDRIYRLLIWVPLAALVYFVVLYLGGLRVHAMLPDREAE